MNRNFKHTYQLAVAISLMACMNNAEATISNGAPNTQATGSNVSGELFVNIWDQAAQTSYYLDLGTSVDAFLATSTSSRSWKLDSTFVSWANLTTDPLTFNVAGNNTYHDQSDGTYGVLMSRLTGASAPKPIALVTLGNYGTSIRDRANVLNTESNAFNNPDYSKNLSLVTTNTSKAAYFGNAFWGKSEGISGWTGSATVRNGSTPDQTLDLFSIHLPSGTPLTSTKAVFDKLDGYLTLDVANAQLSWHSNVTPVPLPTATWLFLSGLIGFFRILTIRSKTVSI